MPSGYTQGVGDGSVTEFEEYALACARNFGALILMRDEPHDAEIPVFEVSDYHKDEIAKLSNELEMFKASSDLILRTRQDSLHRQEVKWHGERLAKSREVRARYESMLVKAKAYVSPSLDHDNYAKFLVSQLEDSIAWDCCEDHDPAPEKVSFEEWKPSELSRIEEDIAYHDRELKKEIERAAGRNEWVAQLRESLGIDAQAKPSEAAHA